MSKYKVKFGSGFTIYLKPEFNSVAEARDWFIASFDTIKLEQSFTIIETIPIKYVVQYYKYKLEEEVIEAESADIAQTTLIKKFDKEGYIIKLHDTYKVVTGGN